MARWVWTHATPDRSGVQRGSFWRWATQVGLGRGLRRATATPTRASTPPAYAIGGRRLAEEDHAHHDGDRRHQVGRHAEAARTHVLEREGVGAEGDGGREHAEVDQPPDR